MEDNYDFGQLSICLVGIAIVSAFCFGIAYGISLEKTHAVKAGAAYWCGDEYGNPKFEYKKP